MTDPKTPVLPESVAETVKHLRSVRQYGYRTDIGDLCATAATQLQEALDRAERAEEAARTWEHNWQQERDIKIDAIKSFRTAEAALDSARKVIEGLRIYFVRNDWPENSIMIEGLDAWLAANPKETKG